MTTQKEVIAELSREIAMRRKVWLEIPGNPGQFPNLDHTRQFAAMADLLDMMRAMYGRISGNHKPCRPIEGGGGEANADFPMTARWTSAEFTRRNLAQQERQRAKLPKETANRMTANIIRVVNLQIGCVAWRINNVGVWDESKQVYRKGNTQKGIADVAAIVRGRALWVEVKAGRDKLSIDQMIFKQEVERAGGLYFEARNTDEFLIWFTEILKPD